MQYHDQYDETKGPYWAALRVQCTTHLQNAAHLGGGRSAQRRTQGRLLGSDLSPAVRTSALVRLLPHPHIPTHLDDVHPRCATSLYQYQPYHVKKDWKQQQHGYQHAKQRQKQQGQEKLEHRQQ